MSFLRSPGKAEKEDHWIPLSDLMTGLMLVFMLIAMVFMVKVEAESQVIKDNEARLKEFASLYGDLRRSLYNDLYNEFREDLPKWRAVLTDDLAIRFAEPEGQFSTGDAALRPAFKTILDSFIPRYLRILTGDRFKESIEEIRIEGHTSSLWTNRTAIEAYFFNMELSQRRTRSTLEYAMLLPDVAPHQDWMKRKITANGLSSSRPRALVDGGEDQRGSQRVEFRVRLNADERLTKMLATAAK